MEQADPGTHRGCSELHSGGCCCAGASAGTSVCVPCTRARRGTLDGAQLAARGASPDETRTPPIKGLIAEFETGRTPGFRLPLPRLEADGSTG